MAPVPVLPLSGRSRALGAPAATPAARQPAPVGPAIPTVTAAQAVRLLAIAKAAKATVDSAILRAADPRATEGDRAAAAALGACSDRIVSSGAAVELLIARLQAAVDAGAGAQVTAPEIAAVESFAGCAMGLPPAQPRPAALSSPPAPNPVLQAVIGAGIPTAASVLIGLLRKK